MKKRTLKEEILRIRQITYGNTINEQITDSTWLDTVLDRIGSSAESIVKKVDEPTKADYVSDNVNDFFNSLNSINKPLSQQEYGSMEYQKEIETIQMALILLGYQLPNHGVDGLFGPETAEAVRKFKNDNNILNEEYIPGVDEMVWNQMPWGLDNGNKVDGIHWKNHDTHIHFGFTNPQVAIQVINKAQELGLRASENPFTSGVDKNVHVGNSFHYQVFDGDFDGKKLGKGLDVSGDSSKMLELFNWVSTTLGSGDVVTMTTSSEQQSGIETITPEMVQLMSKELTIKGIKKEDLDKLIDQVETGGGDLYTDLDLNNDEDFYKYEAICKEFINRRNNSSQITGDMMAGAAKSAFINYHKYVPPELALAQLALEGGLSRDSNARPIKTNNPFNVGNTDTHNKTFTSIQDGIMAYYDLIARDYLGKGKTANDLVHNFVNKDNQNYSGATDGGYEQQLNIIAKEANKIARSIA